MLLVDVLLPALVIGVMLGVVLIFYPETLPMLGEMVQAGGMVINALRLWPILVVFVLLVLAVDLLRVLLKK